MTCRELRQGREKSNGQLAQGLRQMARRSGDQDAALLMAAAKRLEAPPSDEVHPVMLRADGIPGTPDRIGPIVPSLMQALPMNEGKE